MADFATSQWRDTTERAMRQNINQDKTDTDANDFLMGSCFQYCPKNSGLSPHAAEKSTLKPELVLSNFGMKQGSLHFSVEKSGLWTSRLTVKGQRTVAVMSQADVKEYLKSVGLIGKDPKIWLKEVGQQGSCFAKRCLEFGGSDRIRIS